MKIVLGTVQFGVNYGINNSSGKVSNSEVCKIISIAHDKEIRTLDTSSAYGDSEIVLGKALAETKLKFNIVSKYPKSDKSVRETFEQSLKNLGVKRLYGYLVHHFDFYQHKTSIFDDMRQLKTEDKIEKIGFSIYNVDQLKELLDKDIQFDIIQFPYNMFDRQFEPYMQELYKRNVEIHTRSAFLQGLFFKDTNTLSYMLKPLKPYLDTLHLYCTKRGITMEQLALGYVVSNEYVKGNLIGVDNHNQLNANIKVVSSGLSGEDVSFVKSLDVKDKALLNPVNWNE